MNDLNNTARAQISAVVITYNSSQHIRACLDSLVAAQVDKIVVFDNGSAGSQAQLTSEICNDFAEVQFYQSQTNMGFGPGVNEAFMMLEPSLNANDCLWIVNPDTIVDPASASLLQQAVAAGTFDIVSPRITTGSAAGTRPLAIWFDGGELDLESIATHHIGLGNVATEAGDVASYCTFLTGCAMFMSVSTWRRLGGFSTAYFLYWEDADLSWRASRLGMTLGVVPRAEVWHAVGGSGDSSGKSAAYYYYMQRNRILFATKIGSRAKLCLGKGLLESLKLTFRPLRQDYNPISKFVSGLRGILAGVILAVRPR